LTVGLNVLTGSLSAAFSIAAALMCMIYALGSVSGGHFNPAVTLSILFSGRGKITGTDALYYIGKIVLVR
jgi:aquaporin Z